MKKVRDIADYRKWAKIQMIRMEISQRELAACIGIPESRLSEALYGKVGGRKWIPQIIEKLGGKKEDFEEVLKSV